MREFFEKFFKDKKNLILVIILGVAVVSLTISSFWDAFMPFSCMVFGLLCIYVSYLLLLKYVKLKSRHLDEFVTEDEKFKKKKTKFLESENKVNLMLLTGLFFVMGLILIYYGINVII